MTTNSSTDSQAVQTLAAQLLTFAQELAEQPLVGSGAHPSELNLRWLDHARQHLHQFLTIHSAELDRVDAEHGEIWHELRAASATAEAWDEYGA